MLPPLISDINIAVAVVEFLRGESVDVVSGMEMGWGGWTDDEFLAEGLRTKRFVLTHDPDFGTLAFADRVPFHGVLFLRPGDDPAGIVIDGLRGLLARDIDWTPPLLAVYRKGKLRLRRP